MTPLEAVAELQQTVLDGSRRTVETGLDLQRVLNRSLAASIETQREFQRELLGHRYVALRRTLRRADGGLPADTEDLLRTLDHQVAEAQADSEQAVDALVAAVEGTGGAWESTARDSLDTVEQVALLLALDGVGTGDGAGEEDP